MEKIHANIVLEIMGRPPENVKEALQTLAVKIASEKGIIIKSKTIHEPIPVEGSKDLFTSFVELSLEIESIPILTTLLFNYMPSHVEVVSPQSLTLSNADFDDLSNNLTRRLHHYDAVAKQIMTEKDIILRQLYQHAPHLFRKQGNQFLLPLDKLRSKETKLKKSKKANKKKSKKQNKK